ncbi:hypothetical protein BLA29_014093 [Euroglyphus maynei]|uniref:Uncharacterized protein n=1 Tax=Euroglyphus maynei TaxID=6958 RepID=A0A1Y3B8M2_EURMA|nr:hypothetical protein BLA29_014093 [Euroglyphus maynei]
MQNQYSVKMHWLMLVLRKHP